MAWKSVYHHAADGTLIKGSLADLIRFATAGTPIRVAVHSDGDPTWRNIFEPSTIFVNKSGVAAQNVFVASQQSAADPRLLEIIRPVSSICQNYTTSGRVDSVVTGRDDKGNLQEAHSIYNMPLEWFVEATP